YAYCLVEQTNGQVIVGGNFSSIGGQPHTGIARLNLNGTLDSSFNPNIVDIYGGTGVSYSMVLQPDGRIVIGGLFNIVNGVTNNNIVRLNTNGTLDATFYANTNPGYGSAVHCLALQPDGRILVGGYNGVARVYPDGSLDTNFVASVQGDVHTMILQADG